MNNLTIQDIESQVKKHFYVYETKVFPEYIEFHVVLPEQKEMVEKEFRDLWKSLKKDGYVPTLSGRKGEYLIQVIRLPPQRFRGIYVNVILLIATLISTVLAGAMDYAGYFNINWLSIRAIAGGALFFAAPLLLILGLHELGHYFAAKRNDVRASLPFFIPAPSIIGTLGAFISIREPIPDRKALLEIGASGPIVGFLVAIPIAFLGNYLGSIYHPVVQDSLFITEIFPPIIYYLINFFVASPSYMFPTAFAAWVGFVVTAINLLPIGQLDGGHIARAILGEKSRYLSYAFLAFLFLMGFFYLGWLLFALFVLVLGLSHPPSLNDVSRVSKKGYMIGIAAILLIAVTFVPVPIAQYELTESFTVHESLSYNYLVLGDINYINGTIFLNNTGNKMINITVSQKSNDYLISNIGNIANISTGSGVIVPFTIYPTNSTIPMKNAYLNITFSTVLSHFTRHVNITLTVFSNSTYLRWIPGKIFTNKPVLNETLVYSGNNTIYVKLIKGSYINYSFYGTVVNDSIMVKPNQFLNFTFDISSYGNYTVIAYYDLNATVLRITYAG
ncbi:MAG: site-2 protease family protein [Thermoplasmatales archaeon]|jgi:membrane-associated protease RseP (regulator of RpoE activity)|nr:site-2 protease family protein [Thermoplasmatales archaeon]